MDSTTPVGIYIHVPFCKSRCLYCDFTSYAGKMALLQEYVNAVVAEIRATGDAAGRVISIYFGGGTPSLLEPEQVGRIIASVRSQFACAEEIEISLETNPGTVGVASLLRLSDCGVNRLSVGVQSLRDENLRFLGRAHSAEEARQALVWARDAGFRSISADLIFGLPGQTLTDWGSDLGRLLALRPDHISLYGLTIEPNTPLGRDAAAGRVVTADDDAMADMYELAVERLAGAGYRHYEISNWCLPGHECRHNLLYWRYQPYLGYGVAAHSAWPATLQPSPRGFPTLAAAEKCWLARWSNRADIEGYIADISEGKLPAGARDPISNRMAMAEYMFLGLRLVDEGVDAAEFRDRFGSDLDHVFGDVIARLVAEGLAARQGSRLSLSRRGTLLATEVSVRFLPVQSDIDGDMVDGR